MVALQHRGGGVPGFVEQYNAGQELFGGLFAKVFTLLVLVPSLKNLIVVFGVGCVDDFLFP